jgi:hypothetical protein
VETQLEIQANKAKQSNVDLSLQPAAHFYDEMYDM